MDFGDFDFEDDDFDYKPKKKAQDVNTMIKNFSAKIVTSKVQNYRIQLKLDRSLFFYLVPLFEKFVGEIPTDIDDLANWVKMKADLNFFECNFDLSLELYKESLG